MVTCCPLRSAHSQAYLGLAASHGTRAGVDTADVVSVEGPHLFVHLHKPRLHLRLLGQTQILQHFG